MTRLGHQATQSSVENTRVGSWLFTMGNHRAALRAAALAAMLGQELLSDLQDANSLPATTRIWSQGAA